MSTNLFHTISLSLLLLNVFSGKPSEKRLPAKTFCKERKKLRLREIGSTWVIGQVYCAAGLLRA